MEYLVLTDLDREILDAIGAPDDLPLPGQARHRFRPRSARTSPPTTTPTSGRPPLEPLLLLKLEFLQYEYGFSDRKVVAQSRVNMAFRFFLDLNRNTRPAGPQPLDLLPCAVGG